MSTTATNDAPAQVVLTLDAVFALSRNVLLRHGMSEAHADAIARVITQGQRDECHSHGIYRLLVCARSLKSGKVDARAEPTLRDLAPGVLAVNAHYGFSLLAFETGLPVLAQKARSQGIAAMAINRCFHFSALAAMIELLAGALIGDLTSMESQAFDEGAGASPCHGELVIAIDPRRFGGDGYEAGQARAERLFAAITAQGARLPSQRRFEARERSEREGVKVPRALYDDVLKLLD